MHAYTCVGVHKSIIKRCNEELAANISVLHGAGHHFMDKWVAESAERDLTALCNNLTETLVQMKDEECTELGRADPFDKAAEQKFKSFCDKISCQAIATTFADQRQRFLSANRKQQEQFNNTKEQDDKQITVKSTLQGLEDASHISFKLQSLLKKVDTNNAGMRTEKMVWMLAANQASKGDAVQVKNVVPKLKACNEFPKPLLTFMQELAKQK